MKDSDFIGFGSQLTTSMRGLKQLTLQFQQWELFVALFLIDFQEVFMWQMMGLYDFVLISVKD